MAATKLPTGTVLSDRHGSADDYRPTKARETHRCNHWDAVGKLATPCTGTINPGDLYLRVREGWLEWAPLSMECAKAAGVVVEG